MKIGTIVINPRGHKGVVIGHDAPFMGHEVVIVEWTQPRLGSLTDTVTLQYKFLADDCEVL